MHYQFVILWATITSTLKVAHGSLFTYPNSSFLHRQIRASSSTCDYEHTFTAEGQTATLYSENYPRNYFNNLNCHYTINAPFGTVITASCEISIEAAKDCTYDQLYWFPSGDYYGGDSKYACGQGTVDVTSTDNKLIMGFLSDGSNPSSPDVYMFRCQLRTVPATCRCGESMSSDRIMGGDEAPPGKFPSAVALEIDGVQFCGGALISPNWVLTAAHCCAGVRSTDVVYCNMGDHNLTTTSEAPNQRIPADKLIIHPNYNTYDQDNDVCLISLRRPVTLAWNVQIACLPWRFIGLDMDGWVVYVVGWGTLYFGGPTSDVLREVQLQAMSRTNCAQYYGDRVEITERMICTYPVTGKDACQGDSGGPMLMYNLGRWYLVAVVSFSQGCGEPGNPGIYAEVRVVLNWIQNTTGEIFCKI